MRFDVVIHWRNLGGEFWYEAALPLITGLVYSGYLIYMLREWEMFFTVLPGPFRAPTDVRSCAFLFVDNWDDWGKYRTMFFLIVVDENGNTHDIGSVKIGQVGLRPAPTVEPGQRAPEIPEAFDVLDEKFFSLGQGEDYYAALNKLNPGIKGSILAGLRDCAFDLQIFEANCSETVMGESLLRSVQADNVRNRLNRLTRGDAGLTNFRFKYTFPQVEGLPPAVMGFDVVPESQPPTNVHVLIGRNGVGKSRCIRQLINALLGRDDLDGGSSGEVELLPTGFNKWSFAGLILVSFSAFDDFVLSPRRADRIESKQVGLRLHAGDGGNQDRVKSPSEIAIDFRESLERCRKGLRSERWRDAVRTLEVDDLFADVNVTELLDLPDDENWGGKTEKLFERLSSGHAIVLLTVTKLVELVDENTLVLLDEPEGHLHPPLIAAFIRCLSDLLVKRNGVAIIATHSPVVLQEVPRSCAWKLRRSGEISVVERPTIETFGENIGLLTREVFGLEVTRSGFHQLISSAVVKGLSYEDVVSQFNQQLGAEARAIVRALVAERDEP